MSLNTPEWPDVLRFVISITHSVMPDVRIGDRVPRADEFDAQLPFVLIDLLPGASLSGWGDERPLIDEMALDIDVFAHSRAEAFGVANRLRRCLVSIVTIGGTPITAIQVPHFTARPDFNPHIRRLGVTAPITARV